MAGEKERAANVAYGIAINLDRMPDYVKDLFLRLVSDNEVANFIMLLSSKLWIMDQIKKISKYLDENLQEKNNVFLQRLRTFSKTY